jgi:FkbM family methyltransferase
MKNIIDSYGCTFIFDVEKNEKIPNFNWFIDVLQKQTWESVTFNIFDQLKDENKIAIDIGGWIGVTSIYLSKIFKSVITIEADVVAFNALSENINDNQCKNVILYNKAFYNSTVDSIVFGVNGFNYDSTLGSSTSQTKTHSDNDSDYSIETISIIDIIKDINPNDIGLIKVDIEGGDEDVFEELITIGSKYGWKIWIAFHYGWWKDTDITRFEKLIPLIKKVSRDTHEISKSELLSLISLNVPESFLIEL